MHGMKDMAAKNESLILAFHKKNSSVNLAHCSKQLIQQIKVWGFFFFLRHVNIFFKVSVNSAGATKPQN